MSFFSFQCFLVWSLEMSCLMVICFNHCWMLDSFCFKSHFSPLSIWTTFRWCTWWAFHRKAHWFRCCYNASGKIISQKSWRKHWRKLFYILSSIDKKGTAGKEHTAETGTYRWMAPEIIRHEAYSFMADVYSFALIMWQLTTREEPFQGWVESFCNIFQHRNGCDTNNFHRPLF